MDRRARFWLLFLGISALLSVGTEFLPHEDELLAATHAPTPAASLARAGDAGQPPAAVADPLRIEFPRSRQLPAGEQLFRRKSFAVAPPPPPPPAPPPPPPPPPPPKAPPVPFAYVGKLLQDGTLTAYLSSGDRLIIARPGEVIDGRYRVDSVEPRQIRFTYLPLNEPQSIAAGAAL